MKNGTYTTKCETEDGAVYDLGKGEHPPTHEHRYGCPSCLVVNAYTARESDVIVFVCGPRWCRREGQEHSWDGPVLEFPGGEAATCSGCGLDAMTHTLMSGA